MADLATLRPGVAKHVDLTPNTTGCWVWRGPLGNGGYGKTAGTMAHRVIYSVLVGPVPVGIELDHLCRNVKCVNPAHLEPVTPAENSRRRAALKTTCPSGHPLDGVRKDRTSASGFCRYCKTCHRARQAVRDAARRG